MTNNYTINNEDWDEVDENKEIEKKMEAVALQNSKLPDNFEIVEPEGQKGEQSIIDEIEETARQEGLTMDDEFLGGKGATPQEVVDALVNAPLPEGAQKAKEEYETKKINDFKEVNATRELLFARMERPIKVSVKVGEELNKNNDIIDVNYTFKIRRLSESQSAHLLNHTLLGKQVADMTNEEYEESIKFRRKILAAAVSEPKLSEQEWAENVDNALVLNLFEKVQEALLKVNDHELFQ